MKHILLAMTSLVLAACTPSVSSFTTRQVDKLAEIRARGTLVVATDADYLPQSRLIPGLQPASDTKCEPTQYAANQFEGFDVDVARVVADRLGVEPCFVTPPWSRLVAGNWGDNWDVQIGSVAINYDRLKYLHFAQPYYATPTVILVHEDNTSYKVIEDLSGKQIGVCAGCTFENYLRGTLRIPGQEIEYHIQNAQIVAFENEDPAIQALSLGDGVELDAVMNILPKARAAIEVGSPVKILNGPVLFTYASITLDRTSRRDEERLLAELNRIVQELHKSGKLKEIPLHHQGMDLSQEAASFDLAALNQ
ncbi:MAG TPA: transporter substrate-binding domain-containing protein [Anaerolineales bacterium]|nr:transporter substrate-binding domain-containing protein [Anaerolineales bacterium]